MDLKTILAIGGVGLLGYGAYTYFTEKKDGDGGGNFDCTSPNGYEGAETCLNSTIHKCTNKVWADQGVACDESVIYECAVCKSQGYTLIFPTDAARLAHLTWCHGSGMTWSREITTTTDPTVPVVDFYLCNRFNAQQLTVNFKNIDWPHGYEPPKCPSNCSKWLFVYARENGVWKNVRKIQQDPASGQGLDFIYNLSGVDAIRFWPRSGEGDWNGFCWDCVKEGLWHVELIGFQLLDANISDYTYICKEAKGKGNDPVTTGWYEWSQVGAGNLGLW